MLWWIFAAAFGAVMLIWFFPRWQVKLCGKPASDVEVARLENEMRKTTVQLLGGLVVAGGLFFTGEQVRTAKDQIETNMKGQLAVRYSEAAGKLGDSTNQTNWRAGLSALQRVALDSPDDYHWPVMELLTDFIRRNAQAGKRRKDEEILAVLKVIGDRTEAFDGGRKPDLHGVDFHSLNLTDYELKSLDLTGADLHDATLIGAVLDGTVLVHADLRCVRLSGASLQGATLDSADLRGADMRGADLTGATLMETNLFCATLYGAKPEIDNELKEILVLALGNDLTYTDADVRPEDWGAAPKGLICAEIWQDAQDQNE